MNPVDLVGASLRDPDAFWSEQARAVDWREPFGRVCDYSRPPFARWFVGGRLNLCHNAVDRHLPARAGQPAIHFVSTETGESRVITYAQLHREVVIMAATLRSLGLRRGDRAVLYLPMVPEAAVAMLACARLGAVHSAVFAGFAPPSLASRIDDAGARVVITCDAAMRGGKLVPLKRMVDEAVALAQTKVEHVLVVNRGLDREGAATSPRDLDYAAASARHAGEDVPCEWLESGEPSYLLYTSGTTAKPKGIQRDTGGYAVALAASMRHIFDGRPGETYFSTADVGWVVGHSYTIYGPLIAGMTTVIYEGLPTRPDGAIWWKIASESGATVMFSSPTAIRVLKKEDPALIHRHDLGRLRNLFLAGEPLDKPTSEWIRDALGHVSVIDNYWQTETGWPILTLMPGAGPVHVRPGSPGFPAFGYRAAIVDPVDGEPVERGQKGVLAIGLPLPPGCMSTVWRNDDVFSRHYCGQFPGKLLYSTFDYAVQDEDGYYYILGRSDDVINVAGHRLGTREIEEAVSSHPAVAEAATVGKSDEIKGQAIACFVVLKQPERYAGAQAQEAIKREIEETVVRSVGALARPSLIAIVPALPKTRSGKIVRRAILAIAEGRPAGDLSTMEDASTLDGIRRGVAAQPGGLGG
jgi:propionyl-CoA synthetase